MKCERRCKGVRRGGARRANKPLPSSEVHKMGINFSVAAVADISATNGRQARAGRPVPTTPRGYVDLSPVNQFARS